MPSNEIWDRVERLARVLDERTGLGLLAWEKQDSRFSDVYMANMSGASVFLDVVSMDPGVEQYRLNAMDSSGNTVLAIDTDEDEVPDSVLVHMRMLAKAVVDAEEARVRGFLDHLLSELGDPS
ncbi:hypothetical protein ACFYOT_01860 [Saccharothrix saharensis]|uniref:hypothetical protein n=1 Tax=Saccharothrix saharensis TaxID=571190 RepID=UPI00368985C5